MSQSHSKKPAIEQSTTKVSPQVQPTHGSSIKEKQTVGATAASSESIVDPPVVGEDTFSSFTTLAHARERNNEDTNEGTNEGSYKAEANIKGLGFEGN